MMSKAGSTRSKRSKFSRAGTNKTNLAAPMPSNPLENQEAYVKAIMKAQKRTELIDAKEAERKEKLNSLLPITERLDGNKEAQIIAKWEARQQVRMNKAQKSIATTKKMMSITIATTKRH